jgi:nucleoside-diphosphate kinase
MTQLTFSIIKPDATERNLTGKINSYIEGKGLKIVAQKMVRLTTEQAEGFYSEHKERPFFSSLVSYMTSGPVILQVLKGDNAIVNYRAIMGATNPSEADAGTIRKDFAVDIEKNSVHGSDSIASAQKEIDFFFSSNDIMN